MTANKDTINTEIKEVFRYVAHEVGKGYIVDFIHKTLKSTDLAQRERNCQMLRACVEALAITELGIKLQTSRTLDLITRAEAEPSSAAGVLLEQIGQQIGKTVDSKATFVYRQPN